MTAGTTLGSTTLRAGGAGLVEGTAAVAISQTPDVWLEEGGTAYRTPIVIGKDLQIQVRVEFEVALPGPVDVIVSAPPGSGVLFAASPTDAGSESLVVETGFTSTSSLPRTSYFYVQGTIVGDDIDDDVTVTIDVFDTGTTTPAGYEQADKPSNIDVGPSGFSFTTSNDLDAVTFPNTGVPVGAYLLYDNEASPTQILNRRAAQQVRGGHTITAELSTTNPTVGTVVTPAVCVGGAPLLYPSNHCAKAVFDGLAAGSTTIGIIQPAGHTAPANGHTTRNINVDAPDVWLYASSPSNRISDENIGRDLQVQRSIRLEVAPPAPGVDVTIEVIDPTVALISADPTATGAASVTFPLVAGVSTALIYVQGLTLDQATQLRITAPGYDQWITTVQIVDAGFYIWSTSGDFATTVDAGNRSLRVRPATLDTLQEVDQAQMVRGGLNPTVEVTSSDPAVGTITVSPLVFTGSDDELVTQFDPLTVGTTTISISQPPGFLQPSDRGPIVATVEPA